MTSPAFAASVSDRPLRATTWLPAALLDAVVLGGMAMLAYLVLGQRTLYGDAMTFLLMLRDGVTQYERHVLFLPTLQAWHAFLRLFGSTPYQSALLLSQVGGALAVALLYLAARGYGLSRGAGWLTAAGFGLCPASVFFATVVELHGAFMAPVGLTWLMGAAMVRRPSVPAAAAIGVSTALATSIHSSGALLPAPILGAIVLDAWPTRVPARLPRRLGLATLAAAIHGILVLTFTGGTQQFDFVQKMAPVSTAMPSHVLELVTWEWLWPFLPFSLLFLGGLRQPEWRRLTLLVLLALPLYLVPSYLVLAMWREYGAYLIPLAFPAAAIVAVVLRRWLVGCAIGAAATVAIAHVVGHDHPERPREYAAGVRALAAGSPVVLLAGDNDDIEAFFVALPEPKVLLLALQPFIDATLGPQVLAALERELDRALQLGTVVLLSHGAEATLRDPRTTQAFPAAGAILPRLQARYALVPVQARGFAGSQLHLRR